jgi:probable HAF family extracellular repeat protein
LGHSPFECTEAVAINNNNGQALANCSGPGIPEGGAVVWTNGTPTVAGTFSTHAAGTAINNHGQVVGIVDTSTGGENGWLFSNGTTTNLGPGLLPAAINDTGVIVGGPFVDSGGTVQNLNNLIPRRVRLPDPIRDRHQRQRPDSRVTAEPKLTASPAWARRAFTGQRCSPSLTSSGAASAAQPDLPEGHWLHNPPREIPAQPGSYST